MPSDLQRFTDAYIKCALWSSLDEDDTPLDECDGEISAETLAEMRADCEGFVDDMRAVLDAVERMGGLGDTYSQAGHDFWLTRNHHGAGFWESEWKLRIPDGRDASKVLTDAAHAYGEYDLYVGDDRLIYGR